MPRTSRLPLARSAQGAWIAAATAAAGGAILLAAAGTPWARAGFDPWTWIALCGWAGLILASEVAFGPLFLHEPLIAALVGGWILGRPFLGAATGLLFQLTWPGLAPMGGSLEPKAGLGALLAVVFVSALPSGWGGLALVPAVAAGAAFAWIGPWLEHLRRRRNEWRESRLLSDPHAMHQAGAVVRQGLLDALALGALAFGLAGGVAIAALFAGGVVPSLAAAAAGPAGVGAGWLGLTPPRLACFGSVWLAALLFAAGLCLGSSLGVRRLRSAFSAPGGSRARRPAEGPAGPRPGPAGGHGRVDAGAPGTGRLRTALRLLGLQAGFSDRYLQRSGFLVALAPRPGAAAGGRIPEERAEARARLREEMFGDRPPNTQPLVAAALIGALDRVLAEPAAEASRPAIRLLQAGGSLIAQWGDALVWGSTRPTFGLLASALLPLSLPGVLAGWLLLGIAAEILARLWLYRWGWREGWDLVPVRAGSFWHWVPRWSWGLRLLLALALVGWLAVGWGHLGPRAVWTGPAVSVILGGLCGVATAGRPASRGWILALGVLAAALAETRLL